MADKQIFEIGQTRQRIRTLRGRRLTTLARILASLGAILFGVLFVVACAVGVASAIGAGEPTYRGTFTSERCDTSRFGCINVGSWVSDDGSIRRDEIRLDGAMSPVVTVRAVYRPTGPLNDESNNIVHTEEWAQAGLWLPWVIAAFCGAWAVVLGRRAIRSRRTSLPGGTR